MKKIYLACSLTQAPAGFKEEVEALRAKLKEKYETLDFVGLEKGTAQDVFDWNTKCVRDCDLVLAICTYPSIGLGIEIGLALEINKPVLSVASKDALITRMVLGMHGPTCTFARYDTLDDVVAMVEQKQF